MNTDGTQLILNAHSKSVLMGKTIFHHAVTCHISSFMKCYIYLREHKYTPEVNNNLAHDDCITACLLMKYVD